MMVLNVPFVPGIPGVDLRGDLNCICKSILSCSAAALGKADLSPWDPAQPLTLRTSRPLRDSENGRRPPPHLAPPQATHAQRSHGQTHPPHVLLLVLGHAGGLSRGDAEDLPTAFGVLDDGQEDGRSNAEHPDDFLHELLYGILA